MRRSSLLVPRKVTASFAGILLLAAAQPVLAQAGRLPQQLPELIDTTQLQIPTWEDADRLFTLQEAIDYALEESFEFFRLEEKYLQIAYGLEEAKRRLRTRVDFNTTIPSIKQTYETKWVPEAIYEGAEQTLFFVREGISYVYTALKVVQPLPTDGKITLGSRILGYDHWLQDLSGPVPVRPYELRAIQPRLWLGYNQPLFQYNKVQGQLREARLRLESLQRSYTEAEMRRINEVTRQFYRLLRCQRSLEIAWRTFRQSDINYNIACRKVQEGIAAELSQLSLQVIRENCHDRFVSARNDLEVEQANFNRLVGLSLDISVWAEVNMEYRPVEVDIERALELARRNRSDVRQAEIDLEMSELELRRIAAEGRPDLQLDLELDVTGNSARSALAGPTSTWSDHFGEAFNGDYWSPNTNVSLTLRVPIFDWGTNASSVNRQLSLLRVQERMLDEVEADLRRDVENRVRTIESAMQRMEIQEANQKVAQKNYDINQRLFKEGEISSTELLMAQQQYVDTEICLTNAFIEYEMAKANLKEITLWDWETDRPFSQRTTPPKPFADK